MAELKVKKQRIHKIEVVENEDVYDITVDDNHNFFANNILVHNCGEQLLPIGGVCLLGSLNLTQFIDFENKDWDYNKLSEYIPDAIRLMDNVNDITNVPLESQEKNLSDKRRIGLGIMGYGSALMMLKIKYGSEGALKLTEKLYKHISNTAYLASSKLASEKGSFEIYDKDLYLKSEFLKNLNSDTIESIRKNGMRNSHLLSIQPTGNTGILANIVSGGLEPVFMPEYVRTSMIPYSPDNLDVPDNIDWENKSHNSSDNWEWIKEGDENLLSIKHKDILYKIDKSRGLLKETIVKDYAVRYLENKNEWDPKADWASTTTELSISDHMETMAVFAKYIDSAMSKTVNIPNEYSYDEFKNLYNKVYETGTIKGCTTYRAGTMTEVLSSIKKENSENNSEILKTKAPQRPKSLKCDIYHVTVQGDKWIVLVGLYKGEPFEVFAFKPKSIHLPVSIKRGKLKRVKRGVYNLECDNGLIIEDIADIFESDEQEALTRMISTALRHGADIQFVFEQLNKSNGTITSFGKAVGRSLKRYLKDGNKAIGVTCDNCKSENIIYQEGCHVCIDCGSGKCS